MFYTEVSNRVSKKEYRPIYKRGSRTLLIEYNGSTSEYDCLPYPDSTTQLIAVKTSDIYSGINNVFVLSGDVLYQSDTVQFKVDRITLKKPIRNCEDELVLIDGVWNRVLNKTTDVMEKRPFKVGDVFYGYSESMINEGDLSESATVVFVSDEYLTIASNDIPIIITAYEYLRDSRIRTCDREYFFDIRCKPTA